MFFFEYRRVTPNALICKCRDRTNPSHQELYEIKHKCFTRLVTDDETSLSRPNRMVFRDWNKVCW